MDKDNGVVILDAFADYVDGAPKLDQMIFQNFDNSDALVQALKVGDIEMVHEVPASAFDTVQGFEGVKSIAIDGRYFHQLIINSADPGLDPAPTGHPALADPAVRLAMAYAIKQAGYRRYRHAGLGIARRLDRSPHPRRRILA